MTEYRFVTVWTIPAPREVVWRALTTSDYSTWWPSMREYRPITPGPMGVGSISERVVRGRLPYDLRYRTTLTRVDRPRELAYDADGDLRGHGRMLLDETEPGGPTRVTFHWNVGTTKRAMNWLAPLLRPVFAWNHNAVMSQGERGLTRWLADNPAT